MSAAAELEARVVDLELRFMALQREMEQLSDVVRSQRRVVDALTAEAKRRRDDDNAEAVADERPPHF